jgi:spermidine/putrescine transport system substrate-binding protein
MPVRGSEEIYTSIVEPFPECEVTIEDLERELYFDAGSVEDTQARDAAYTEIKVG